MDLNPKSATKKSQPGQHKKEFEDKERMKIYGGRATKVYKDDNTTQTCCLKDGIVRILNLDKVVVT